jgi:hypothetical protein
MEEQEDLQLTIAVYNFVSIYFNKADLEIVMAPTDLKGNNPKASLRPHAVGNSYGCPKNEKCEEGDLKQATDALREVGVFMSVAGN